MRLTLSEPRFPKASWENTYHLGLSGETEQEDGNKGIADCGCRCLLTARYRLQDRDHLLRGHLLTPRWQGDCFPRFNRGLEKCSSHRGTQKESLDSNPSLLAPGSAPLSSYCLVTSFTEPPLTTNPGTAALITPTPRHLFSLPGPESPAWSQQPPGPCPRIPRQKQREKEAQLIFKIS